MQEKNVFSLSFGCRLNSLESEKISNMLAPVFDCAIIINTCSVTATAERGCAQAIRKLSRENPNAPIFITGCGATRNPELFKKIPNCIIIANDKKMDLKSYTDAILTDKKHEILKFNFKDTTLSKKFIQIQNGCNHGCTYCITRLLRGKSVSFEYETILNDVRNAVVDGFFEIVLTGVDIASFAQDSMFISNLCKQLLNDVPEIKRLRLSSMDPASPEIPKLIELIKSEPRMMPHLHLSLQSGSDTILRAMLRRHNAEMVRDFVLASPEISFGIDLICGFPGETDELFADTLDLISELKFIKVHAFPFSPRPGTIAATLPNQINRSVSKNRVKIATELANKNLLKFVEKQIGTTVQVLMENNNIGRTPDDIEIKIMGEQIKPKTVCDVKIINISDLHFIGEIC